MITVYHGTSLQNFKSICNDKKLIASKGNTLNTTHKEYVYLATNFGVASAHGYGSGSKYEWEYEGSDPYVVIQFKINENKLLKDFDVNYECDNWLESAIKNNHVSTLNECEIPNDAIVYFVGGEEFMHKHKTTFNKAMEYYKKFKNKLYVPPCEE